MEEERREVIFQGHVQGVGFRYTTRSIAERHAVTGFVRNLANGDVQLVAEGSRAEVKRFLEDVEAAMASYIRHVHAHSLAATGEFSTFEIRH